MMNNLSKYQKDLDTLIQLGDDMLQNLISRQEEGSKETHHRDWVEVPPETGGDIRDTENSHRDSNEQVHEESGRPIETHYQGWYSECHQLIKQLLPHRLEEFKELYLGGKPKRGIDPTDFGIQHWLLGMRVGGGTLVPKRGPDRNQETELVIGKLRHQIGILDSTQQRFQSSLFDIKQMVQADVFDSELEAADDLAKNGFTRAAGSLAGVVLEKHLGQVASNHAIAVKKQNPTISDFNDALKNNGTLDTPTWRQIQRLGDIRNLCSHSKEREPAKDEVSELIAGVWKFTKTLF